MSLNKRVLDQLVKGSGFGDELTFDLLAKNADSTVTVSVLLDWITEYGIGGRKSFCDAVGIGESTLSNWIKEDRLPKMAKIVVALHFLYESGESAEKVRSRLWAAVTSDRLVLDDDSYVIVSFDDRSFDPEDYVGCVGRVVARNIESREDGMRLLSHQTMRDALVWAQSAFEDLPDTEDNFHLRDFIDSLVGGQTALKRPPAAHSPGTSDLAEGDDAEKMKRLRDEVGASNA